MKLSQTERLLKHFMDGGSITSLQAYSKLGITQLGTRIFELKQDGYIIVSEWVAVTNRFGEKCHVKRYSLAKEMDKAA
ncbi:MAG: hypothetical protein RLZZ469_1668 [Bacteroidota bacterium]|jgi:hypothetical protein